MRSLSALFGLVGLLLSAGVDVGLGVGLAPLDEVDANLSNRLHDLNSRRGQVAGTVLRADAQVVAAIVPLSNMFGYATSLRSATQGRAIYSMQFARYQEVPKKIAEEIVAKVTGGVKVG